MAQAIEFASKTKPRFCFATMRNSKDGIFQSIPKQHAITTVPESHWRDANDNGTYDSGADSDLSRTWVLVDANADGISAPPPTWRLLLRAPLT